MNHLNDETKNCCIETIAPRDDWLLRIGHRFINLNYLKNEDMLNRRMLEHSYICRGQLVRPLPHELERSLYDIIEEDPLRSYNYIERESVKTQILIPRMALYLSARTIEAICDKLFTKKDINEQFVQLLYQYFFSVYFKRVYSWSSLHLLIKASKAYPVHFKTTLKTLLVDIQLKNNLLLDYIETLSEKDCTRLLKFVTELQLTPEQFNHNLPVIYLMFKKCEKNDLIFQYIQANLELYNLYCAYNKNYGRLLLCFIQSLSGFNVRIRVIKRIIENHCTSYKSPCMAALEKFVLELIALQINVFEGPRIVIPRPVENFQL